MRERERAREREKEREGGRVKKKSAQIIGFRMKSYKAIGFVFQNALNYVV